MVVAGTGGFVLAWSGSVLVVHVEGALVHVRSWSGVVVVGLLSGMGVVVHLSVAVVH